YDLLAARRAQSMRTVALVRIEQLYPFPIEEYQSQLARYADAADIVWCQEEPQNQGAWYQIRHRLQDLASTRTADYAGRAAAAAPATGLIKVHQREQQRLVETALTATSIEQTMTMRSGPRLTLAGPPVGGAAAAERPPASAPAPIRKSS